jgi:hypothetical protein
MMALAAQKEVWWKRLEMVLLILCIGLALWPVWGNSYYLTGDGPCHLYNARILRDMLLGQDQAYYSEWFTVNPAIEPNWLNHVLLALFQVALPALVAEKLFLTLYILGFGLSFRYLARSIYPANEVWIFLAAPFIFHKVFLLGFFNYSASVVIFFWVVGYWLRHRSDRGWRTKLGLGLRLMLLLLAHPMCYGLALALLGLHWLGESMAAFAGADRKARLATQWRVAGGAVLAGLPSVLLLGTYLMRQAIQTVPSQAKTHKLFHDFLELKALVLFQDNEKPWPIILALLIGLLFVVGFFRLRKRPLQHEGILAMFVLSIYFYFTQPAQVGGFAMVPERMQFFPYLIALCWLVTLPWPAWLLRVVMVAGFAITATLYAVRLPSYAQTNAAVVEFASVQPHMRPHTTVLMLDYAPEGRLPHDGPIMSKEAYIFMHIAEYLGAMQPHIILNNYEANTKWFPLRWNPARDPYVHLAEGPGFEGWFPTVNFEKFRTATGQDVDYVITWCFSEGLKDFEGGSLMPDRLAQDYREIFVSDGGRVHLFERIDNLQWTIAGVSLSIVIGG